MSLLRRLLDIFNSPSPAAKGSWMLDANDPVALDIARRAGELGITGDPDNPSHYLGKTRMPDGTRALAFVVHAVDPVITDGKSVVMIDRAQDPGKGLPALPGGFLDPKEGGGVETAIEAGIREAFEEAGIILKGGVRIGQRAMVRPFDVRIARGNGLWDDYGIAHGDVFTVSTQTVRFDVPDMAALDLKAGDDALPGSARLVAIADITRESVGIPDHADAVREAVAGLQGRLPCCDAPIPVEQ